MTGTEQTMSQPEPPRAGETSALTPRRGPDLFTLVAGLGSLGIAAITLLGGIAWFPDLDGRWVLAAMALIVGLLLVVSSLRPERR